jgi:subtilisin family serine protease
MKQISGILVMSGILATALISGCQREKQISKAVAVEAAAEEVSWQYIPGQYIVVYDKAQIGNPQQKIGKNPLALKDYVNGVTSTMLVETGIAKDVQVELVYANTINGFAARISESALEVLKKDPRVAYVKQDILITLGKPGSGGTPGPQVVPPGMNRVHWANYSGENVAWILDTGIDLDHPDLNVNKSRGFNAFTGSSRDARSLDDLNGHGSHVAGIVAARNNDIGVVGVAAGATVIPVKVLGSTGSGSYSGVIAGVDHVAANGAPGDVANMSLGGPVFQPLDDAILAAVATSGIKFVLAAGNEKDNANNHSPARTNGDNIYTISAMNASDVWAGFSNYGPAVDFCAPGVNIYSTYKNGGYTTYSGTSMAAPHAAGVLLHGNHLTDGTVSNDPDGVPDPIIVH